MKKHKCHRCGKSCDCGMKNYRDCVGCEECNQLSDNQLKGPEPESIDDEVMQWIVLKASVTHPHDARFEGGRYWSASVTLGGMDINGIGDTIQRAYLELRSTIVTSAHYRALYISMVQKKK